MTDKIYQLSTAIKEYKITDGLQIDVAKIGTNQYVVNGKPFIVEVIDSVANYVELMKQIFDFDALRAFVTGKNASGKPIRMRIDSMNGGTGGLHYRTS